MNISDRYFHANGKLLLSGEYFVLDGALALAVPVKQGQSLRVEEQANFSHIAWESADAEGNIWFKALLSAEDFSVLSATDAAVGQRLSEILTAARAQNEDFLPGGAIVRTETEFPREWGLGTSSTLLYCIARWAEADAYRLLFATFGGSGYDLACAGADSAIFYRLRDGRPVFHPFPFQPSFRRSLYFVYLGKKQDSREGIARYREQVKNAPELIEQVSALTESMARAETLAEFNDLIRAHEEIVSRTLKLPRAKDLYFSDFGGEVKSLGAWGGDFVMVTSENTPAVTRKYFAEKGYEVCLSFDDLVL